MLWKGLDDFCNEPFWDYQLTWNATNPDITPCFHYTLLSWLPCIFLWMLTPLELYLQKSAFSKTMPWTGTNVTRMIVAVSLVLLCLADMMHTLFNRRSHALFTAILVANVLKIATFILSVILMGLNKKSGIHTSGVLFFFWFFLIICEILPYRSALMQLKTENKIPDASSFIFQMLYFPVLVTEFILTCIADVRRKLPRGVVYCDEKESPEQSASFLSKLLFWWFNGFAISGWRKPLTVDDLWQLNQQDRAEYIATEFEKYCFNQKSSEKKIIDLNNERSSNDDEAKTNSFNVDVIQPKYAKMEKGQVHVAKSLCKTFWISFSTGSFCKLIYDILQFVSPVVLKLLIDYVQSNEPLWKGILFAFILFLNGTAQSVLLGVYFQRMFVLGMRVRTALMSAIYKKSLILSSDARKETTIGEVVNLMSVDSQRFMDLMTYLNMLWSAPLQILISIIMLWNIIGPSVLAGLLVMIILIPANAVVVSRTKKLQMQQMENKDERVKLMNEILSGIKVLKLYAWEEAFKRKILGIRDKEIKQLRDMSYLNAFSILIWNCSPFLVAMASFATFVLIDERNILDAKTAFVSLSLFNILRFPLTMLPSLITTLVMVNVSVKRINKFMNSEELEEYVIHGNLNETPISIQNGNFSWSKEDSDSSKICVNNINITVKRGSLVAVVGQVGSGKSSLLSAILGEMERISGKVNINGSTALVSQQPWIQNATLMNNIVFSQPFNKEVYREILAACGLLPDLEILPGGDQTEIGEKGINLSGGQKQRVSLARALYSSADIYLLDDPLSAVDAHVGQHIFDKVIGKFGLLRNKTRILVTHGLSYLSQTDVIIVMKDGYIAEMGSFQHLIDKKGPFAEFLSQYLLDINATDEDLEILEDIGNKNPKFLRSFSEKSSESDYATDERRLSSYSINRSPRSLSVKSETKKEDVESKLIQTETAETGEVLWSVYVHYLKAIGYHWVVLIQLAYIGSQAFSMGSNVWLSIWGTDEQGPDVTQNIAQRNIRLGVYGGLGAMQALFVFLGAFSSAYGTLAASKVLHGSLLHNVLRSPMSFFDTTPVGRIINRFAKDIDTVDVTIPMTLRSWLMCLFQVIATLIIIICQTPIFMIVIIPLGIVYYLIQKIYVSTSRQLKRLESITRSPIYSHFSETLTGSSTIRAYGVQDRFCTHSNNLVDKNQICYYPSIVANRWLAIILDFCGNSIILFSALFSVLKKEELDPGEVGLSVSYALMVTATLNWLVRMTSELETNIVAVERILEYTETPREADWINENYFIPDEWPQKGHIQFQKYCTRYRKGLDLVLKGIDIHISPGQKIGIVGRTGAGKSSLTLSLFRIIEATSGAIVIDDIPIEEIGLHQLRSKLTIIPQDPVLFSGTLRLNLDPFNWYSDEQISEALSDAHLQTLVSTLEKGLQHEIVEGGENLSVGQRQLVCLARALLRKTKVLVLDEATAAVDLETDDLIQATIRKQFSQSTVLTIAHRLNTVMDYDKIMVLFNGRVREFDAPKTLLRNKKSDFYDMAKSAGLI